MAQQFLIIMVGLALFSGSPDPSGTIVESKTLTIEQMAAIHGGEGDCNDDCPSHVDCSISSTSCPWFCENSPCGTEVEGNDNFYFPCQSVDTGDGCGSSVTVYCSRTRDCYEDIVSNTICVFPWLACEADSPTNTCYDCGDATGVWRDTDPHKSWCR